MMIALFQSLQSVSLSCEKNTIYDSCFHWIFILVQTVDV